MTALDNITIFVLTGLAHFGLAAGLWAFRHTETDRLLKRIWLIGQLAGGIGMIVMLGRRDGSLFWFSTIPNALIYVCLGAQLLVVRQFFALPLKPFLWPLALIIAMQFVLRPLNLIENWRLFGVVIGSVFIYACISFTYWQHRRSACGMVRFLLPLNLFVLLAIIVRMIEIISADAQYSFFNAGWGQTLAVLALFINAQANGIGFLLMMKERADQELLRLATLDPLTEIANRRSFVANAKMQLALAERGIHPVSVLICDIDHFKQINDHHGHHAGDDVIRALVQVICQTMRAGDSVGRWGGEEFVIMLPHTAADGALQFAQRLNQAFAHTAIAHNGDSLRATVSIGITEHQRGEDIQTSIDRADTALYRAKEAGRNRVELAAAATEFP